ncbi:MAG: hypothetical protein WBD95_21520 [Xanthobacteraceae bacterium]
MERLLARQFTTHFHDVNRRSTFDIDAGAGSKSAPLLTWPDA